MNPATTTDDVTTPVASTAAQAFLDDLLQARPVMYGPDPAIFGNHHLAARSAAEERALEKITDPVDLLVTQSRLEIITESAKEMLEQIGAAPGAKWGDLTTGLYTAEGDLALASSTGVVVFAAVASPIVKFIMKNWVDESTVGIRPGDVFYHNDARYGGVHNADQSLFIPIFVDDQIVAWAGAIIHEGENGATEPGGLPPSAKSPYDEGLKISPMKVAENYTFRRDIVNLFQNNVRDPLLQLIDMRSKLAAAMRMEDRVLEVVKERGGPEIILATLRSILENTEAEVHRRLSEWPDGTFRAVTFGDTTLLEDRMIKMSLEVIKTGDRMMINTTGTAPHIPDRAINTMVTLTKSIIGNDLMNFFWADLPRNAGFSAAIDFALEENSILTAPPEAPISLSMLSVMFLHNAIHQSLTKMAFNRPGKAQIIAPWYSMVHGLFYGGLNQWGMPVANLMTDINAMGGGAHPDRDGEHAAAPFFAALADYGEMEDRETELPVLGLSRRICENNHGYGTYRGGASVECAYMVYGVPLFGFGCMATGAKFPTIGGLFGGYGSPSTPVSIMKPEGGMDEVRRVFSEDREHVPFTAEDLHRDKPFKGSYETRRPTQAADFASEGELWILKCGGGGGYGDPLERDPEAVMKDLRQDLITPWVAERIYHVVYDPDGLIVDERATEQAREDERAARKQRGTSYDEFVSQWRRDEPPAEVPFLGSWAWRD